MNISDLNYVEYLTEDEQLGTVVGGTFGLVSGLLGWLFGGYQQQPTTVVNNYIYVTSDSNSSANASSGAPSGSSSGSHH